MDPREFFKMIANAKEKPSDKCVDGGEHDFQFLAHGDGAESYSYFYRCSKCCEVIVQMFERDDEDKLFWKKMPKR